MALTGIDPATLLTMKLASEVMDARAVIRHQRTQLAAMAAALRTQQLSLTAMADVVDALLSEPGDA